MGGGTRSPTHLLLGCDAQCVDAESADMLVQVAAAVPRRDDAVREQRADGCGVVPVGVVAPVVTGGAQSTHVILPLS